MPKFEDYFHHTRAGLSGLSNEDKGRTPQFTTALSLLRVTSIRYLISWPTLGVKAQSRSISMAGATPRAPSASTKPVPKTEKLPARRLAPAPLNCVGSEGRAAVVVVPTVGGAALEDVASSEAVASSEDVVVLRDDVLGTVVDAGAELETGATDAVTVGVSVCDTRASLISALTASTTELAAASSVAVNEYVV
jgi:hypothetical protein